MRAIYLIIVVALFLCLVALFPSHALAHASPRFLERVGASNPDNGSGNGSSATPSYQIIIGTHPNYGQSVSPNIDKRLAEKLSNTNTFYKSSDILGSSNLYDSNIGVVSPRSDSSYVIPNGQRNYSNGYFNWSNNSINSYNDLSSNYYNGVNNWNNNFNNYSNSYYNGVNSWNNNFNSYSNSYYNGVNSWNNNFNSY